MSFQSAAGGFKAFLVDRFAPPEATAVERLLLSAGGVLVVVYVVLALLSFTGGLSAGTWVPTLVLVAGIACWLPARIRVDKRKKQRR